MKPQPTIRKPLGIIMILLLICIWAYLIGSAASWLNGWHVLVQGLFYLFTGIIWIAPLGPLLRWMETGRLRKPD